MGTPGRGPVERALMPITATAHPPRHSGPKGMARLTGPEGTWGRESGTVESAGDVHMMSITGDTVGIWI